MGQTGSLLDTIQCDPDSIYRCSDHITSSGFTKLMMVAISTKEHNSYNEYLPRVLIEHPQEINKQNTKGWTALMLACRNIDTKSTPETVKILLHGGADPNIQNTDGWTALMIMARYGAMHIDIINMLLDKKANVNIKTRDNYTALNVAVSNIGNGSSLEIVKILINAGADINHKDNFGQTSLYFAISFGKTDPYVADLVKLLVENGADMNIKIDTGGCALTRAAINKNLDIVELLINLGADIENKNFKKDDLVQDTILMYMIRNYNTITDEYIELIIKKGADLNYVNKVGDTPLSIALYNHHMILSDILLNYDIQIDDDWLYKHREKLSNGRLPKPLFIKILDKVFESRLRKEIKKFFSLHILKNIKLGGNAIKYKDGSIYSKLVFYNFEIKNGKSFEDIFSKIDKEMATFLGVHDVKTLEERLLGFNDM